jgi:hypothetical protein
MELYCTPKVNTLQLNTVRNPSNTCTHLTCMVSEHSLQYNSSTRPLVAIFQHSLPFLQSESFQTHVDPIHCQSIGPLAHHNGTFAYSPSLTCHLPAPTIKCLHRPRYKLTCSSRNFPIRTQSSNQKGVHNPTHKHVCTRTILKTH